VCVLCAEDGVKKGIGECFRGANWGVQQSVTLKRGRMCSSNLQGTDLSRVKPGHRSPGRRGEETGAVGERQVRMAQRERERGGGRERRQC